jgi:hypothetical protein
VQYDLTLRDAIDQRYFYVWCERWSFRTAKTHARVRRGRRPDELHNSAFEAYRQAGVYIGRVMNGKQMDQGIARKAQQEPEGEMEGTETSAAAETP